MKKSYADMEPLEELRTIREEMSREFKTVGELFAYLRKKYPHAGTNRKPHAKKRRAAAKAGRGKTAVS